MDSDSVTRMKILLVMEQIGEAEMQSSLKAEIRRSRIKIAGYSALIPILLFIIYELGWWYLRGGEVNSYTLVEKDFPSALPILAVTLFLPSISVFCGVMLMRSRKERRSAFLILSLSLFLVILSVLFRPV
ncbi:MAG: hypothetical protein GF417_07965 [Candidatus Latescibacteria bacterium]|nr:hypothetical protein [bacterium]MBD3424356.1 hypothetical protein [Candidatus Latescibacterota bacterium]